MKTNPANETKDSMWDFLKEKDGHAKGNVKRLKESVYDLIKMTTQKGGGTHSGQFGRMIPFEMLDMVKWEIICESTALVLSGKLDALEGDDSDGDGEEL